MATMENTDAKFITVEQLIEIARDAGRDWFNLVGDRESPLSGEWAGESIPEISDRYDLDLFDSDLADAFEEGFELAQVNSRLGVELDLA